MTLYLLNLCIMWFIILLPSCQQKGIICHVILIVTSTGHNISGFNTCILEQSGSIIFHKASGFQFFGKLYGTYNLHNINDVLEINSWQYKYLWPSDQVRRIMKKMSEYLVQWLNPKKKKKKGRKKEGEKRCILLFYGNCAGQIVFYQGIRYLR